MALVRAGSVTYLLFASCKAVQVVGFYGLLRCARSCRFPCTFHVVGKASAVLGYDGHLQASDLANDLVLLRRLVPVHLRACVYP